MFFDDCYTMDEARKKYRDLAKKMHPDIGGNNAEMARLNAEYSQFSPRKPSKSTHNHKEEEYSGVRFWNIYDSEDVSDPNIKYDKKHNKSTRGRSPWNATSVEQSNWEDGKNQCDYR